MLSGAVVYASQQLAKCVTPHIVAGSAYGEPQGRVSKHSHFLCAMQMMHYLCPLPRLSPDAYTRTSEVRPAELPK